MDRDLERALWLLSRSIQQQPPKEMEIQQLLKAHATASQLYACMQEQGIHGAERVWAEHLYQQLSDEIDNRGLKSTVSSFSIAVDGTFTSGREELKKHLKLMDFDEVMDFVDNILETSEMNENQRQAVIQLAEECTLEEIHSVNG